MEQIKYLISFVVILIFMGGIEFLVINEDENRHNLFLNECNTTYGYGNYYLEGSLGNLRPPEGFKLNNSFTNTYEYEHTPYISVDTLNIIRCINKIRFEEQNGTN